VYTHIDKSRACKNIHDLSRQNKYSTQTVEDYIIHHNHIMIIMIIYISYEIINTKVYKKYECNVLCAPAQVLYYRFLYSVCCLVCCTASVGIIDPLYITIAMVLYIKNPFDKKDINLSICKKYCHGLSCCLVHLFHVHCGGVN